MTGGSITALARATEGVVATVREAAARTGVDFSYLLAQARIESGLDPQAAAPTSSARGLFQFTASTWLETLRRHGAEHGLGWAAEALSNGTAAAGSAARSAILALRQDAEAASLMAGEFARDNGQRIEARLGRAATATDLYMAHFLGAGGATQFLKALAGTPDAPAASVAPAAARANRAVFFGRDGHARSLTEVYQRFATKFEDSSGSAVRRPPPPMMIAAAVSGAASTMAPEGAARAAYLLLAELGG